MLVLVRLPNFEFLRGLQVVFQKIVNLEHLACQVGVEQFVAGFAVLRLCGVPDDQLELALVDFHRLQAAPQLNEVGALMTLAVIQELQHELQDSSRAPGIDLLVAALDMIQ